jgi:acyl-CoA carboxylase subunit beta
VQVAENLYERGLVDVVLGVDALAEVATRALNVLMAAGESPSTGP